MQMLDKIFIDTNIIIYSYSNNELYKQEKSNNLFFKTSDRLYISTQVISELSNILFRKFNQSARQIEDVILELDNVFQICSISLSMQLKALKIKERYLLSYFDSLIIANALENKGTILYSEDMQHNLIIEEQLRIINPFKNIK